MTIDAVSLLGRENIIDRLTTEIEKQRIVVSPILSSSQIQPASMDLRLGAEFLIIKTGKITYLNPLRNPNDVRFEVEKYTDKYNILNKNERFILHPDKFVLGCTLEYIRLPLDIAARVEGRSSLGRLGILVHSTAGYIDPGFCGNITFELKNMGKVPIPLYPGTRIAQLAFFKVFNEKKYKGKYNESFGVVPSKYFDDYEFENMRKDAKEYYETNIFEIFESVRYGRGLPQIDSSVRFPNELIDAIRSAFERYEDGRREEY